MVVMLDDLVAHTAVASDFLYLDDLSKTCHESEAMHIIQSGRGSGWVIAISVIDFLCFTYISIIAMVTT